MRIALCLHGYFNNKQDSSSGDNGFKYLTDLLLEKYNVDVFFHSWELDKEVYLKELYKPVYYISEEQIDFKNIMKENNISQEYFDQDFDRKNSPYSSCKIESSLSFLYSRKKSLELAFMYEQKKKFTYDIIISARFDLGQRDKFGNWKHYVSQIKFEPTFNMNYIYSAMWDQINAGYADQWFYSNSENMKILSKAYDNALLDLQEGSVYENILTHGWPDSIEYDGSFHDPRQFTNEKLKKWKSTLPLMKYPLWQCVNNHLYYKWYFIKCELYNKSKFV
jgi:hypothetical protein